MKLNAATFRQLDILSFSLSQMGYGLSGVLGFLAPLIALLPYLGRVGLMQLVVQVTIYALFSWLIAFVCHLFFYYTGRAPDGLVGLALVISFLWSTVLSGPDSLRVRAKVSREVCQYIELIRYPDAKENLLNDWTLVDTARGVAPYEFDRLDHWKRTIRESWIDADVSNFNHDLFEARWREFIDWFDGIGFHGGKGLPPEDLMPRLARRGRSKWNSTIQNFEQDP